jgi:hypothetical protein
MGTTTGTMQRVLGSVGAAIIGSWLFGAQAVQAAPVTFQFTVTVDRVEDSLDGELFGPLEVGDKIQGWFTYDTASPDFEPGTPQLGYYEMVGAPAAFGLVTPARTFVSEDFWVNTLLINTQHSLTVQGWAPINNAPLFDQGYLDLNIIGPNTWLPSDAPPSNLSQQQIAGFNTGISFYATKQDAPYLLRGHLTYDGPTTPPAVPEPASLMLLGTGLLGMVKLRRKQR